MANVYSSCLDDAVGPVCRLGRTAGVAARCVRPLTLRTLLRIIGRLASHYLLGIWPACILLFIGTYTTLASQVRRGVAGCRQVLSNPVRQAGTHMWQASLLPEAEHA